MLQFSSLETCESRASGLQTTGTLFNYTDSCKLS